MKRDSIHHFATKALLNIMNKENFLNNLGDIKLREKLYHLFEYAETEARSFLMCFGNWISIDDVVQNSNGKCSWYMSGPIAIISMDPAKLAEDNDLGAMFHEIFHSAFHGSPLWHCDLLNKTKYNNHGMWGDAFCDVFRYFMEERLFNSSGKYFLKINSGYLNSSFDEVLKIKNTDKCHDIVYAIPASTIIKNAGGYIGFKKIWAQINNSWQTMGMKDENFLETYFNLPMKELQKQYRC